MLKNLEFFTKKKIIQYEKSLINIKQFIFEYFISRKGVYLEIFKIF